MMTPEEMPALGINDVHDLLDFAQDHLDTARSSDDPDEIQLAVARAVARLNEAFKVAGELA
jgi:hypothetical protein